MNPLTFLIFTVFILQQAQAIDSDPCTPKQIHLALSDAFTTSPLTSNSIRVIFHTQKECKSAYISLQTPQGTKKITATAVDFFTQQYRDGNYSTYVHIFDFPKLDFSQTYQYSCYGSDQNAFLPVYEGPFEFYLPSPYHIPNQETKIVMFGDMDISENGLYTVNRLKSIAQENFTKISTFIHNGDISYNLYFKAGQVGDDYMNSKTLLPPCLTWSHLEIMKFFTISLILTRDLKCLISKIIKITITALIWEISILLPSTST